MNRTGSIGSRVPPADTTTRTPARSAPVPGPGPPTLGVRPPAMPEHVEHGADDTDGSASRPAPMSPPASRPCSGGTTVTPRRTKGGQVLLDRRMLPHLGVHGRADHHGCRGGDQRGGQEIVGEPAGVPGQEVGGGRRHHDEVGALAQAGCGGWPTSSSHRLIWVGSEARASKVACPRTGWPVRSGRAPHGCRRRPTGGRRRPPCRRRSPPTPRGPRTACRGHRSPSRSGLRRDRDPRKPVGAEPPHRPSCRHRHPAPLARSAD